MLRGREPGESTVPDRVSPAKISDADAMARLQKWVEGGRYAALVRRDAQLEPTR